jgi:hypothetical protein
LRRALPFRAISLEVDHRAMKLLAKQFRVDRPLPATSRLSQTRRRSHETSVRIPTLPRAGRTESVLQTRHEGPGFKASKIRTKRPFLCVEIGNLLGFPNSVSNRPSQQVQRYGAKGEPFPAAVQPSHTIGFHPTARETCASRRGRGHQRLGFICELAEVRGFEPMVRIYPAQRFDAPGSGAPRGRQDGDARLCPSGPVCGTQRQTGVGRLQPVLQGPRWAARAPQIWNGMPMRS